jgi:gas vesicle protein
MIPCESKGEIEKLNHAIYGNGKIGMKTELELMKHEVKEIKDSIESLGTSYAALAKSQVEQDLTARLKIQLSEKKMNTWTKIAIIAGVSIPLTALIIELV